MSRKFGEMIGPRPDSGGANFELYHSCFVFLIDNREDHNGILSLGVGAAQ